MHSLEIKFRQKASYDHVMVEFCNDYNLLNLAEDLY